MMAIFREPKLQLKLLKRYQVSMAAILANGLSGRTVARRSTARHIILEIEAEIAAQRRREAHACRHGCARGPSVNDSGNCGKEHRQLAGERGAAASVSKYDSRAEWIFVSYDEFHAQHGNDMKEIPWGAVTLYTYCQKFNPGMQYLMAGSRNFRLSTVSRKHLMALNEEMARVSGIDYVMNACRDEAEAILDAWITITE